MRYSRDIATQIATIVPDYEIQLLVDLIGFIKNQHFHVLSPEISNMTQLRHIIMNHISEINVQWKADVLDIFYNQTQ